ncbi:protein mono-ADP-ribosyltransferase PARP14 [Xenopus tropicalis]|uniref:Poly [ADP-ribose] polymerase n=1 Tax=Xenopus tropicalis TaxID=8364 RepID=A0A8J0QZ24_XENTR|nr:protein mono-ADP-ribosyltransferase PARP14 [Xenopus tropicalis]|eukprot:XP_002942644.2 PREDICTED: poly [ADP-ribose] polymerase 14-like [Xenopus tropicalis]
MGEPSTFQFPVALQWDLGPEKLKEVKNKLLVYFQSKSKSNGGECVIRDPDCTPRYVLIHFSQETVRDRVLQKQTHELSLPGGQKLKLNISLPEAGRPNVSKAEESPAKGSAVREPKAKKARLKESPAKEPAVPLNEPSAKETSAKKTQAQEPPAGSKDTENQQEPGSAAPDVKSEKANSTVHGTPNSMVLIENLQESYTAEMLNLLVEKDSGKAEGQDFYVEMIPEIHSAVVTFTCDIDIPTFIGKLTRNHRVKKQKKLTVKVLEETKSIRVENLPPDMSDDLLEIYFENPRYGGGEVQEVELIPEENTAIITFHNIEDAKRVLGKQHVFRKQPISVYPYYESLGLTLYGEKGPCVTLPEPLEVPVSPYVLEFILGDPQIKGDIDKKMADKNCEMTWPDPNCPNPNIKLSIPSSISSHLRTVAKIVRTWRDQVSTEFSLIISKFKDAEYDVIPPVWEAIKREASSSSYGGVLVKPDLAKHKVFLAGLSKVMTKVEKNFRDLVENTTRRIDRQNRSMEMSEPLAPALYEIMCKTGQMETIQSQSPELRIEYDVPTRNLKLYGVKEEVLSAKCEILKETQQLKSKPLPLDPHIIHFLGFTDNDELSCLFLTRHNINAMFQTEGKSVTLTGLSMKDLSEAEAQMGQELVCKQLTVEDKMIIKGPEWRSLHTHLCELFNSEKCTVVIEEFPRGAENQVVIAGLAPSVGKASQQIHDFLERNTPIQKDIPVTSAAVIQFIKEEKQDTCMEIKKKNVSVTLKRKSIALSGSKLYVQEAAALIERVLSSLHTNVLRIKKPGAKKFWIKNEEMYVSTAKNKFQCLVHFQKDGEDITTSLVDLSEPHCQVDLPQRVTIAVYKDDLTRHRVDVVVNAAREDLKHTEGLALALLNAAGPKLQTECDHIIKREGKYSVGDSVITGAGNLPCKQVIHTVSPKWDPNSQTRCTRLLRRGISRCLELAAENGLSSIGIPAVGSQMSGFPVTVSVQNIVESVRQYVESPQRSRKVTRIHLVDSADGTVAAFAKAVRAEFGDYVSETSSKGNTNPDSKEPLRRSDVHMVTTKEGVNIKIIQGNIQDATTDVIVNSVGKDLDLNTGAVSKALNAKAGTKLQQQLREMSRGTQVEEGSVFVTNGFGLNCKKVIHVVTPGWDQGKRSAEKILRTIMTNCLSTTEKEKLRSITFPAIGTGALGFPKDLVASLMFDEVLKSSCKGGQLQEVNFLLHPSDMNTIKAFKDALSKRAGAEESSRQAKDGTKAALFGLVSTPTLGVHEMRIGSLKYQVRTGDITKESTDVIVNSSNSSFTQKIGVSKAILEAAGKSIEDECATLGAQANKGYIVTQKGNLPCRHIIHVYTISTPDRIKASVLDVLQECENLKATSVALPAVGTGAGGATSAAVAAAMLDAVEEFVTMKSPKSVQTVKVIVFQQKMLDDFYKSMMSKEGTGVPAQSGFMGTIQSFWNYLTSKKEEPEKPKLYIPKQNIEPAVFHLCGEEKKKVMAASSWLEELLLKEQHEDTISDAWILEFEEHELKKLTELQKKSQVSISIEPSGSAIRVSGLTRDVFDISKEIHTIIKEVNYRKTREREEELYSNLVEWRYHDGSGFVPFDKMSNLDLEKAQNEGKLSLTVDVGGVKYTVNMEQKSASDGKGKIIGIERVCKGGLAASLPGNWDPMDKEQMKIVPLSPGSPEYNHVGGMFARSCQMRIITIQRVQNQYLWQNYQIKKQSIDNKTGSTNNEKQLFHGTDPGTIDNVNNHGFNRSYAGKNAAVIGNGTYFAVDANYSADDTYSKPDPSGHKHMYLARVLTGTFTTGQTNMITPPPKNQSNPTDLYDSVTDNINRPSMFVIFNDIQAYPEYLITFTR